MSNFVYLRQRSDTDASSQFINVKDIANDVPSIQLPSRFNSRLPSLNTFSLGDIQKILNTNINNDIQIKFVEIPNNPSIMNFNIHNNEIIRLTNNGTDVSYTYVKNTLGLRFNPSTNQTISNLWRPSGDSLVLINTINYLDIKSGNILKRADNNYDTSAEIISFATELSSNQINFVNRLLGTSKVQINNFEPNLARNFSNLFPSKKYRGISGISSLSIGEKLDYYQQLQFNNICRIETHPNYLNSGSTIDSLDDFILLENISIDDSLKGLYGEWKVDSVSPNLGSLGIVDFFINTGINIQKINNLIFSLNTESDTANSNYNIFIIATDKTSNMVLTAYYRSRWEVIEYNVTEYNYQTGNSNYNPQTIKDIFNVPLLKNERKAILCKVLEQENNHSQLFIDDQPYYSESALNFLTSFRNIFGQNIKIPSLGVQQMSSTSSSDSFLTHIDNINPRSTNILYSIYPNFTYGQTDLSFLNPKYYNINFNEKSWFRGNVDLNGNRGITISNLYFDPSTNGNMMYQYYLGNRMNLNNENLLTLDNSNIVYTLFCNIKNGIIEIDKPGLNDYHLSGFNYSNNISTLNPYILTELRRDTQLLKIVGTFACLYFKNSTYKFLSDISSTNTTSKYVYWDDTTLTIRENNLTHESVNIIPLNKIFYNNYEDLSNNRVLVQSYLTNILNDFFIHLNQFLFSYKDYLNHTVIISTRTRYLRSSIGLSLNIPQIRTILPRDINNITSNPFYTALIVGLHYETIIVGVLSKLIFYYNYNTRSFNIFDLNTSHIETEQIQMQRTQFPILKNIYLRYDLSNNIILSDNIFSDNRHIRLLDLTGINATIGPYRSSAVFNNMSSLETIIVNDNNLNLKSYISNPNVKNIFIKSSNNSNLFNTSSLLDNRLVTMDIPHNTNVLFPNPTELQSEMSMFTNSQ